MNYPVLALHNRRSKADDLRIGVAAGKMPTSTDTFVGFLWNASVIAQQTAENRFIAARRTGKSLSVQRVHETELLKIEARVAHDEDYTWTRYHRKCVRSWRRTMAKRGLTYVRNYYPERPPPVFNLLLTNTDIGHADFTFRLSKIVVGLRRHWWRALRNGKSVALDILMTQYGFRTATVRTLR